MSEIKIKVRSLPVAQQIATYVILRMANSNLNGFSFLSSSFALAFKPFVKKHITTDMDEYGKFIGGILSGLMRNDVLVKLSGDRDKLWTLSDEIKKHFDDYKELLFEMKVYWK